MGDLYTDDIEDAKACPDDRILSDVHALVDSGEREGTILDYKRDLDLRDDKDNWVKQAAAFANTFGGLIVFGVEGKGEQPRVMTGFDPKNVETGTKLINALLSRIQPRPNCQVRVVAHDIDVNKEVALLRISEGARPPYVYSHGDENRVYVRVGPRKAEADYLQLRALIEKGRGAEPKVAELLETEFGREQANLSVFRTGSDRPSPHYYRFVLLPDDSRAARRLTNETESQLRRCLDHVYGSELRFSTVRTRSETYFQRKAVNDKTHRFGVTENGSLGFATEACVAFEDGPRFFPSLLCRDLSQFLVLSALFYARAQYFGTGFLRVNVAIPETARLFEGVPSPTEVHKGRDLFDPPLESIRVYLHTPPVEMRVDLHPCTRERLQRYMEEVMNAIARLAGGVLVSNFGEIMQPWVDDAVDRFRAGC